MIRSRLPALIFVTALVATGCSSKPCGNGKIDGHEECDGVNLNGYSCEAVGYSYGTLKCDASCKLDATACVADPCWTYPCDTAGTNIGDVIENMQMATGNGISEGLAGQDGTFGLDDLYRFNEAHGGNLKGALLFISAQWCPVCADEAETLEALYDEYADRGILIVGLVLEDDRGDPATADTAVSYAATHGWSFPAVPATLDDSYWHGPQGHSYPLNLFVDLTNMRLTGRIEGGASAKLIRLGFDELVAGVAWSDSFERPVSFDCAPGTGNEVEPNGVGQTPADASTRPYTLSGTICGPVIAEDLQVDEDVADLGTLTAGTAITATMERSGASKNYPFFVVARVDEQENLVWQRTSAVKVDGSAVTRQIVVPETGHYLVAAEDGRISSWTYYGNATIPSADDCCEGGPDYTYSITVGAMTLAATEPAVAVGTDRIDTVSDTGIKVYPLAVTATVTYTIGMHAVTASALDPDLLLVDATTGAVLAENDDIDATNANYNSQIAYTPTADGTVWIVADFVSASLHDGPPQYHLTVN